MNFTFGRVWFCVLRCGSRVSSGSQPVTHRWRRAYERTSVASERGRRRSRASVTRLRPMWVIHGESRFARAIFRNEKESRGRLAGWRTLSKICLVLRRPPELLGYSVTVPRPTSVPQYTCRYSLAGHSHRANKCAADARRTAFLPTAGWRGLAVEDRTFPRTENRRKNRNTVIF